MKLLAVDTSHAKGSLALSIEGRIEQVEWTKQAMHSEVATLELQRLLSLQSCGLTELTHIAVNIGPGSFTGLRVGISLAKTLAYALNLPVASAGTLELLAFKNSKPGEKVLVAIKAIQNFYYAAAFERHRRLTVLALPQSHTDPMMLARELDCTKVLIEDATPAFDARTEARDLVQYLGNLDSGPTLFSWQDVKPLYIRASQAEEKLKTLT